MLLLTLRRNLSPVECKIPLSAERFWQKVSYVAYNLWKSRERQRRDRNWMYMLLSLLELGKMFAEPPVPKEEMDRIAYEVYEAHKEEDAMKDWFDAEVNVRTYYRIEG